MTNEYMFVFDPKTTFSHHIEILFAYIKLAFPELVLSMFDDYRMMIGDALKYKYLPIRLEHTGKRENSALVQYVIGFVSGDPNDTFCMEERILDHGWYECLPIS